MGGGQGRTATKTAETSLRVTQITGMDRETYVKVTTFSGYEADWEPSVDWSQAGPIIDREDIHWGFGTKDGNKVVIASKFGHHVKPLLGPTPLIAALRCFVASRLGDEAEIPEELCK
jgi:hypothetical protein